jgi:hypothetical protein
MFYYKTTILTFESQRLSLCATRFNTQEFCVLPTTQLYVLRGSENKQQLFLFTACVYCAVRTGSLNQIELLP